MKFLTRILIVVFVLFFLAALAWYFFPGFREKGKDFYRRHGGWTEDARRSDPVGFIDYAESTLQDHLAEMKDASRQLDRALARIAQEEQHTRELSATADSLAGTFREQYQQARQNAQFPVQVKGETYSENELREQVRIILLQRQDYQELLEQFRIASELATEKRGTLASQISRTQASLATLPAKREIARVNELSGHTEELMAQVNDVIADNSEMLAESPVRTVEQLIRGAEDESAKLRSQVDVDAFLEGTE